MIDISNLSIQFTGENLFEGVTLRISRHDKIALVGSNGTGKTTFLKLLYGTEQPETGNIKKQKGIKIGYLPQDIIAFRGQTLFSEVKSSLPDIRSLDEREKLALEDLNDPNISEEDRAEVLEELGEIEQRKEQIDFYSADSRIEKVLMGLGFKEKDFFRRTEEFSGGWQMRIQMTKILLSQNDLLLMDEPTNHLDIDTLGWLINFLQTSNAALLIISHDRYFINSVTNRTIEIFDKQVNFYSGNYSQYLVYKEEREKQIISLQKSSEKRKKEIEKFVERFRYKASKARQVQSRIKQLEKMETFDLHGEEKKIEIRFPEPPKSGVIPVEIINVNHSFGSLDVLKNVNLQIEREDKIAIVGPNGAGKTTLAKIIASKLKSSAGSVELGHNTLLSYYEQEVADSIEPEYDLIDALEEVNNELSAGQIRSILGSFLFSGDEVFKKIKVLSGGERSRVALSRLLLTKANVIILDEPTNHLDFSSKAVLQEALINFSGSLIIVSHDVDFLRPIVNKVIEIRDCLVKVYPGTIDYYMIKREELFVPKEETVEITSYEKTNRKELKRIEAELRQKKFAATKEARAKLEKCENEISGLEEQKVKLENELSEPKIFSNPQLSKEKNLDYEETKTLLDKAYIMWTELSDKLEKIEKEYEVN
ncbi:MAG: ABC-F family ATP-binding cassette domain-containing protein [Bacteroidota bacterium]